LHRLTPFLHLSSEVFYIFFDETRCFR
jgi:hypothetical protein